MSQPQTSTTPTSTTPTSDTPTSTTPTSTTPTSTTPTSTTPTSTTPTSTTPTSTTPTSTTPTSTTPTSTTPTSTPPTTSSQTHPTDVPATSTSPPSSTPSPTTTPSPTPLETLTTITSAYTTYVNGSQLLTTTSIPSTIPETSAATSSSSHRSAVIAGSAAGGTALLILVLSLAFCARRKRFKKLHFLDAIMLKRKQDRSRATLLDGEDIPEPDSRRYLDHDTWGTVPHPSATTFPPQRSESGSAFREDFWPPPGEATRLMDPLAHRDDLDLDFGRIVDDVMGPSAAHFSDQSVSSVHRASVADSDPVHSRTVSNASNAALLEAAGLAGPAPLAAAPVRSSPLAQPDPDPPAVQGNAV